MSLQFKKIAQKHLQNCPYCGMPQEGIVNGTYTTGPGEFTCQHDKWYSFCNCKNIFFTNWENMDQTVYDESYQDKYLGEQVIKNIKFWNRPIIDNLPTKQGTFLEIGVTTDTILDLAKERGYKPVGLDINENTKSKYIIWKGNIEDQEVALNIPKVDVIWIMHVLEHTKDPLQVCRNLFNNLNDGGSMLVAMPDPWFIPWESPNSWCHWHLKEHHIMWDMDSFIDEMIAIGFKLHAATRRAITTDYQIIFTKNVS